MEPLGLDKQLKIVWQKESQVKEVLRMAVSEMQIEPKGRGHLEKKEFNSGNIEVQL
jgi:hypothetical protein